MATRQMARNANRMLTRKRVWSSWDGANIFVEKCKEFDIWSADLKSSYATTVVTMPQPLPTTAKSPDPTLNSACSHGQLTRSDTTDRSALVFLAAEAPPQTTLGGRAGSKSKSQQPYDKDGLLTTTRRAHNSTRPARQKRE